MSTAWPISVEMQHCRVDFAMRVERKIVGSQEHRGVDDGNGIDEHASEDGRFGVNGGRAGVVALAD